MKGKIGFLDYLLKWFSFFIYFHFGVLGVDGQTLEMPDQAHFSIATESSVANQVIIGFAPDVKNDQKIKILNSIGISKRFSQRRDWYLVTITNGLSPDEVIFYLGKNKNILFVQKNSAFQTLGISQNVKIVDRVKK